MGDDLTTAAPEEQPEEVEAEFEITTRSEYVACATNALQSIDGIDEMILSDAGRKRIKRIRFKSLRIIDEIINEMYDEIFDDSTDADLPQ
jgi:hypothetical protein